MKYIIAQSLVKIILNMVVPIYVFEYLIRLNGLNLVTILLAAITFLASIKTTSLTNKQIAQLFQRK